MKEQRLCQVSQPCRRSEVAGFLARQLKIILRGLNPDKRDVNFCRLLLIWLAASSLPWHAYAADETYKMLPDDGVQWKFAQPSRVVAIGDIHGDPDALLAILVEMNLIGPDGKWVGGDAHLVFTGDLVGRGADSSTVYRIVLSLAEQAKASGGMVHALVGNHDYMVQEGDMRYIPLADAATYKEMKKNKTEMDLTKGNFPFMKREQRAVVAAHTGETPLGRWNSPRNAIIQIGDVMYVHGGFERWMMGADPGRVNATLRGWVDFLHNAGGYPGNDYLWVHGEKGPLWTRELNDGKFPNSTFAKILRDNGATKAVVAHNPTRSREIETRYGGKLLRIDTGISQYYGGKLSAVEFDAKGDSTFHNNIPRPVGMHPIRSSCDWALAF